MLSIEFVKLVIAFFHFKIFIGFSLYPLFLLWNFLIFICLTHAFMMTTLKSLSDNLIQHHCHLGASICWLPFFFIQLKIFLALCMMRNFWWKSGHFMYCLMRLWILNCLFYLATSDPALPGKGTGDLLQPYWGRSAGCPQWNWKSTLSTWSPLTLQMAHWYRLVGMKLFAGGGKDEATIFSVLFDYGKAVVI